MCEIEVEPLPRGEGFVYEDKIFGGAIPQQFIPSIEKGIVKTMSEGVLSGNPMVDIKVTLVDGKFHAVDSSDMAFQIAGSLALKEAVEQGGVALLEPVVQLAVTVPEAFTGDIMGDLNAKRGKIQGMEQIGGGKQVINALVPQARGRPLRHRPPVDDGRPRRVLDDVLPLRRDAAASRPEGDRRVPSGSRGSPQEIAGSALQCAELLDRRTSLYPFHHSVHLPHDPLEFRRGLGEPEPRAYPLDPQPRVIIEHRIDSERLNPPRRDHESRHAAPRDPDRSEGSDEPEVFLAEWAPSRVNRIANTVGRLTIPR